MISNLVLTLDGKELNIPIQLTEAQIRQIFLAASSDIKISGWEKPELGNHFYYEDGLNRVQSVMVTENSIAQRDMLYDAANCYSSETVANNMSRGDTLIRTLRRFAAENRTKPIDFTNQGGYTITYNYNDACLEVGMTANWMALGDIIFETEELAREAINQHAAELIWYFTEMTDRL